MLFLDMVKQLGITEIVQSYNKLDHYLQKQIVVQIFINIKKKQGVKNIKNMPCGCLSSNGNLIYKNDCKECNPNGAIASANRKYMNSIIKNSNKFEENEIIARIVFPIFEELNITKYWDKPLPSDIIKTFERKVFPLLDRYLPKHKIENRLNHLYLGCDIRFFRFMIERQLREDWHIGQYRKGIWDNDHIIPCSKVNLEIAENIMKVFHWNNIQPISTKENQRKGAR